MLGELPSGEVGWQQRRGRGSAGGQGRKQKPKRKKSEQTLHSETLNYPFY